MHFLAEYFPLILFFVAFKVADIYVATAVAIAASIAQIVYFRRRRGRVAPMHWLSLAIIVIFGGATLLLHDETFIKWKPTVLYWLFGYGAARRAARVSVATSYRRCCRTWSCPKRSGARSPGRGWPFWRRWAPPTCTSRRTSRTDVWVNFKIWGGIGMFMLAAVGTVASVARYLPEKS